MNKLKQRLISLTTVLALLCAMFTLPVSAAYENTHVNTGNHAYDVLNVALTQLGYAEGSNNETKYGAWYPMNYNPWCAMFVSWCAEQAGISTSIIPKHASCDVGMTWFKRNSVWKDSAYYGGTYTPLPGDVIYFGVPGDSDHVGYVMSSSNGKVHTIEGNASDKVMQKSYSLTDSDILGYGVPAYNQVVASGSCGDNVIWSLNGAGILQVAGSGPMADYTDGTQPWIANRSIIKTIVIHSGVTAIGNYNFCVCPNLTIVNIPDTVTDIGVHAFSSATALSKVTLPAALEVLDVAAFGNTPLTSITIPASVKRIGDYAFWTCTKLTEATVLNDDAVLDGTNIFADVASGFTLKGNYGSTAMAYASENGHTFVSLNGEPEIIASGDCGDDLTWTLYPNGELVIDGTGAMWEWAREEEPWGSYRDDILTVTISENVTAISNYAFSYCGNLSEICADADNASYSSDENGVLYNKDKTTLVRYPVGKTETSFEIPDGVTTIGVDAFHSAYGLTSVTLPDSVKVIEEGAFYICKNLESITIPDGVTTIGADAFEYCESLTSVTIPDSVTTIGDWAFGICVDLKSVVIGDGVTNIGEYAFYYCLNLTNLTIGSSVETIGDSAFNTCCSLTSVTLPDSVTSIGSGVFGMCESLTSVTILGKTTEFGEDVFYENGSELVIYGYEDSTAEAYAADNSLTFAALDEAPDTAVFTLSAAEGVRGQTVAVEITLENTEVINSVALFDLTYSDALTFAGFADYEEIEDKSLFTGCYDEENRVISIALTESETLSGSLGKILFTINDDASKGLYTIGMTSLVKLDDTVIPSEAVSGSVRVKNELLGDLDGSGAVNINDARILFRHSMLPEVYPISYTGDIDFTGDGVVDINDARRLFQYSMLPEIYPIG